MAARGDAVSPPSTPMLRPRRKSTSRRKSAIVTDLASQTAQLLPQLRRFHFFGKRDERTILAMARSSLAAVAGNSQNHSAIGV